MSPSTPRSARFRLPALTAEERELFQATLRDVKPLGARRRRAKPAPATPEPPAASASSELAPRVKAVARIATPAIEKPPANPGIDRRTAERVRKGEIPIDRRLDLHGMTQDDAHAALDRFVRQAWTDAQRMLLVITGKGSVAAGGGILRKQVPRWLAAGEHAARVLKVHAAQPRHGGGGALYVLLRRRRERA